MKPRPGRAMGRNAAVNASGRANGASDGHPLGACPACLRKFRLYRRTQRFCSARCRLLDWAAREIADDPRLDPLREVIRKRGSAA